MTKKLMKVWVEALRSGKYKQGKGFLRDNRDNYCCLGVFLEATGVPCKLTHAQYPREVYEYTGETRAVVSDSLKRTNGYIPSLKTSLAELNDVKEYDFNALANIIEEYYEEL